MDSGDYIYIVIAIILAVINAVAKKKKKEAAAQKTKPNINLDSTPESIIRNLLEGKTTEDTGKEAPHDYNSIWGQNINMEKPASEEPITGKSNEQEHFHYITVEDTPLLDVVPPEQKNELDKPESVLETLEEGVGFSQDQTEEEPDIIFDLEKALKEEQKNRNKILEDFDPVKAIIYSEIMNPKYL